MGTYTPKAFDASMYDTLRGRLGQAVAQDAGTANTAFDQLKSTLSSNYQNAFAQLPQGGQSGMDQQAMQRFLQQQGVDPSVAGAAQGEQAGSNQAFANLWRSGAANEDSMQQGRLANADISRQDTLNRLRAEGLRGSTGIDMQQGAAQRDYNTRTEDWARQDWQQGQDRAYQDAIANWQRGNQVSDTNTTTQNGWTSDMVQALLGFIPSMGSGVQLPPAIANLFAGGGG
jgi:hypothetical protein